MISNTSLYVDILHENGSGSSLIRAWREGLPKLLDKLNSQFKVDFKPVIIEDKPI